MEWKLAGGRLKIHILLIPVCGLLIYFNGIGHFIAFFAALLIHELFHLFTASALGVRVLSLELLPFGCAANMGGMEYTPKGKEVLIAAAGPAASLIAAAACEALGAERQTFGAVFQRSNLALGAMNLMPAYPLDGGRIAAVLLEVFLKRRTARRIAAVLGMLTGGALCAAGIFWEGGLSFLVMGGFMVLSSIKGIRSEELNSMASSVRKRGDFAKHPVMDVKHVACGCGRTLGEVYVSLDQRKYNMVYLVDEALRVRGVLDEGTLLERMLREGSSARIMEKQKESEQNLFRLPK